MWSYVQLGYVALRQGNLVEARENFGEALALLGKLGKMQTSTIVWVLEGCANLAAAQGQSGRALYLLEWATAALKATGEPWYPIYQANLDRDLAIIRSQLNEDAITAASAASRAMTVEQAIEYAAELATDG